MDAQTDVKKKNSKIILYAGVAAVVILVVGYLLYTGTFSSNSAMYGKPVSASDMAALRSIAENETLANKIGVNSFIGTNSSSYAKTYNLTPIILDGKPEVLYIGTEWCPYCGATRWAVAIALMRFGNLTGLQYSASSSDDYAPNTPTFSFNTISYSSPYISFKAVEYQDRNRDALGQMNTTEQDLFDTYGNGIPFLDIKNEYIQSGSLVAPLLLANKNWGQVISTMADQNTTLSNAVISAANFYTAEICTAINNTAPVCSQGYVKSAQAKYVPMAK